MGGKFAVHRSGALCSGAGQSMVALAHSGPAEQQHFIHKLFTGSLCAELWEHCSSAIWPDEEQGDCVIKGRALERGNSEQRELNPGDYLNAFELPSWERRDVTAAPFLRGWGGKGWAGWTVFRAGVNRVTELHINNNSNKHQVPLRYQKQAAYDIMSSFTVVISSKNKTHSSKLNPA